MYNCVPNDGVCLNTNNGESDPNVSNSHYGCVTLLLHMNLAINNSLNMTDNLLNMTDMYLLNMTDMYLLNMTNWSTSDLSTGPNTVSFVTTCHFSTNTI
jgi:hypothetical protein